MIGTRYAEELARAKQKPMTRWPEFVLLCGIAVISGALFYFYVKDWISL